MKRSVLNASLSTSLEAELVKQLDNTRRTRAYFWVTELVNPVQAYWLRKRPDVKKTPDVARKMARGTQIQKIADYWFRELPGYVYEEAVVDGACFGIHGAVGKIDYRLSDSIVELKSKSSIPQDAETVLERYPQDLEQLLFYAVLMGSVEIRHYLIFVSSTRPFQFACYEVLVNDKGSITTLLRQRIHNLERSIEDDDLSHLGRCRYFDSDCQYRIANVCRCHQVDDLSTTVIRNSITMSRDKKFETVLTEVANRFPEDLETYSYWNVLTPRKWFLQSGLGVGDEWIEEPKRAEAMAMLRQSLFSSGWLDVPSELYLDLPSDRLSLPLEPAPKLMKYPSSKTEKTEDMYIPFLLKVHMGRGVQRPRALSKHYAAELAIRCYITDKPMGILFMIYPNVDYKIVAYEYYFNKIGRVGELLHDQLAAMTRALKSLDGEELDECPSFLCEGCKDDNGLCPVDSYTYESVKNL